MVVVVRNGSTQLRATFIRFQYWVAEEVMGLESLTLCREGAGVLVLQMLGNLVKCVTNTSISVCLETSCCQHSQMAAGCGGPHLGWNNILFHFNVRAKILYFVKSLTEYFWSGGYLDTVHWPMHQQSIFQCKNFSICTKYSFVPKLSLQFSSGAWPRCDH